MSKQIRPLTAFKKSNPDYYKFINQSIETEGSSKKDKENKFYWMYGYLKISKPPGDKPGDMWIDSFFWKNVNEKNNKLTITELGRLLLTGWYYEIESYCKQIAAYIYKAYYKKHKEKEGFNDLEYYKVVKHIRENILYYYNNQPETKFFILDSLFKKDLQELLPPPPDELKEYNKAIELLSRVREEQKKAGIEAWINRAEDWEGYSLYLQELLDSLNVTGYLTFKEWKEKENIGGEEYLKKIESIKKEYKNNIANTIKQIKI